MIVAKHRAFSAAEFVGDAALARALDGGDFTTIYLSPGDYHRVHMPCAGRLIGMRHIPGSLFSVRPTIVRRIDGLLARNERLVCWFAHPDVGTFAVVLVGAAIVGSIATSWHGVVAASPQGVSQWDYGAAADRSADLLLAQGEELGYFQLGSTVVVMLPRAAHWTFDAGWQVGRHVHHGQAMAQRAPVRQAVPPEEAVKERSA